MAEMLLVGLIVGSAVGFICWQALRSFRSSSACSKCQKNIYRRDEGTP